MSEIANKLQDEYWRPPAAHPQPVEISSTNQMRLSGCPECGSEFVMGARFCHVCGFERQPLLGSRSSWTAYLDFGNIQRALGVSAGSLVAFMVGIACTLAALFTGLIYSANTFMDWQAVQVWRIEWLLAAAVAFLAGVLLKKKEA